MPLAAELSVAFNDTRIVKICRAKFPIERKKEEVRIIKSQLLPLFYATGLRPMT